MNPILLNIFSGYGKSEELYFENARPKSIKISLYAGVNPDGYVSEFETYYKAVKFPQEQIIHLSDIFGVQSVALNFDQKKVIDFTRMISKSYDSEFKIPKVENSLILKIEILKTYPGTVCNDICISEISFNDRLIAVKPAVYYPVTKLYLNQDENTLLLDNNINTEVVVYSDTSSVLQIIEVSENKQWAIIISMPFEIQGRVESSYLLINLVTRSVVNSQLEKITGCYFYGNEMYFDKADNNRLFLMYSAKNGQFYRLELK